MCLILPIKGFRVIASSVSSPDILSGSLVSCSFILLPQTAGETKFLSRMVFSCFEASVWVLREECPSMGGDEKQRLRHGNTGKLFISRLK